MPVSAPRAPPQQQHSYSEYLIRQRQHYSCQPPERKEHNFELATQQTNPRFSTFAPSSLSRDPILYNSQIPPTSHTPQKTLFQSLQPVHKGEHVPLGDWLIAGGWPESGSNSASASLSWSSARSDVYAVTEPSACLTGPIWPEADDTYPITPPRPSKNEPQSLGGLSECGFEEALHFKFGVFI
ncbi:unnamed protein product [Protopolystoma xenopodis]|uniref:Uncharacterized protein n=1 Tax=Protopolystoma xenopodis TaxID=117903 RepID=A0A3S5BQB8_9PLAT|nr:unnamed protein product [Protopolystoma xenopodis]